MSCLLIFRFLDLEAGEAKPAGSHTAHSMRNVAFHLWSKAQAAEPAAAAEPTATKPTTGVLCELMLTQHADAQPCALCTAMALGHCRDQQCREFCLI